MKGLLLSFVAVLVFIGCGGKVEQKAKYNYISAEKTAELIKNDSESIVLVDIQEKDDFKEEHLKGAVSTYAYPVKTDEERARLTALIPTIKSGQKIIIICPRGGGGANRAYDFFLKSGLKKDTLFTLTDGQYGWPREKISDVLVK
ncbi:rhodanese-like domain-containing protein [Sulfurospirillum arcachonense]|uniref:rhodanese-like domain-containing protein n=1 Tax=Sulfurospirillum arcachonense TaxID=57666 RepID=UPI0004689878|nr:rhodanese-like domain-containing protein [Sulfurospirillum arcachonense]